MKNLILTRLRIFSSFMRKFYFKLIYSNQFVYGKKFYFRKRFNLMIEKNGKVILGKRVFFNNDCSINCVDRIIVDDYTIFGENVKIYDHNHVFNKKGMPVSSQGLRHSPVTIGKNCWIGSNVTILKGTTIGDNCVIGAGCVVSDKIPSGTILKKTNSYSQEFINYH